MKRSWLVLSLLSVVACSTPTGSDPTRPLGTSPGAACGDNALSAALDARTWEYVDLTAPITLSAPLGCLTTDRPWSAEAAQFADELIAHIDTSTREGYVPTRTSIDALGQVHVRLQQTIDGIPVVGAELLVHADRATGEILHVNGRYVPATGVPQVATVLADDALAQSLAQAQITGAVLDQPQLGYVLSPAGVPVLAWSADVSYLSAEGPELDTVFADATTGELVTRHPHYMRAKNREVYDSQNGTAQGPLVVSEGGMSGDNTADLAHDYMGDAYDYLFDTHGRDSWDDGGATLISWVHYSVNYNNAFWNGSRLTFGDGDGSVFSPLSESRDVVAHELGHGTVQETAGLIYQNESGALNEAYADIFAAATDIYMRGGTVGNGTWLVGEEVYTPGTNGDALRYMDNPTQDGISYDYWPERYTGGADSGGVHLNSGIANLAFVLMVEGGDHPRDKTIYQVDAIGISATEQIFYRALSTYLNGSSNFGEMRTATGWAARDLFAWNEYKQVHNAWSTVGVPGSYAMFSTEVDGKVAATGYAPMTVNFIDESVGAATWNWQLGTGSSSVEQNPSFTYANPGTYNITLEINGDPNTTTPEYAVTALEAPAVDFTADTLEGHAPLTVNFENLTSGGTVSSYEWDFGDVEAETPSTSTDENPSYEYAVPGEYTVSLTVEGGAGLLTETKEAFIVVTAKPDDEGPFACLCAMQPHSSHNGWPVWLLVTLVAGAAVVVRRKYPR